MHTKKFIYRTISPALVYLPLWLILWGDLNGIDNVTTLGWLPIQHHFLRTLQFQQNVQHKGQRSLPNRGLKLELSRTSNFYEKCYHPQGGKCTNVPSHNKNLNSKSVIAGCSVHKLVIPHPKVPVFLKQQGKHGPWRQCDISE